MKNEIIKYLSKYIEITPEIEEALLENTFVKSFKKGTILLKEGDKSNECYFILKGCIRSYYLKDGEEKTTEFYTEEQAVTPLGCGENIPSKHFLECIEDTIVNLGTPDLEKKMNQKFPVLQSLSLALSEAVITKYQDTFAEFKMANPEQRYINLLKTRPDLIQRVPQHQIASYLGIKPESLSRIRKRLSRKKM
jgi:CRP-like cAMP-binding protein